MSNSTRIAVILATILACLAAFAMLRHHATRPARTPATVDERYRPPGPPDRPHVLITDDHQLKAVQHKDFSGLSALEYVETPEGRVTIQRTFSQAGSLLKEEAFLNGKAVPVPPPSR